MILDELPQVKAMPTDKKAQLIDELMGEVERELDEAPLSAEVIMKLQEREADDPTNVRTWDEVRARISVRRQSA